MSIICSNRNIRIPCMEGFIKSPYETLNFFYIDGIPFLPLCKRGKAVNCRIGLSKQLVFIPAIYFNDDLTLKNNVNLSWFINKQQVQHKIKCYLKEIEG